MAKKTMVIATIGLLVLAGIGVTANWLIHRKTPDVHHGLTAPFVTSSVSRATTSQTGPGKRGNSPSSKYGQPWAFYGRTLDRTRNDSNDRVVHPPFRTVWSKDGGGSLEYPPSYANGMLFEATNSGVVTAFDVFNGKEDWRHRFFNSVVGTPAIAGRLIYLPCYDGRLYALYSRTGKTAWARFIGGMIEGSPAVWKGRVYEGSVSGSMRAFNATTGRPLWRFTTAGAVKHGPAIVGERLYFGDYAGYVYCLNARTGTLIWRTHTAGLASGFGSGSFYATPAVAYGRVYISNTDGKVYSLVASNGSIAWTHTFPAWAYGSPAVSEGRVFATAWDGSVAALSARTGSAIWTHRLPNRTLASPVVIGNLVYIADRGPVANGRGEVFAFGVRNGRQVWHFSDGKYSSVIAAAGRLIVTGIDRLYALEPKNASTNRTSAPRHPASNSKNANSRS
ncbi:MAG: PQQ-binding-like beta-propeller repeat protein [Gaiellaceae bacterium]